MQVYQSSEVLSAVVIADGWVYTEALVELGFKILAVFSRKAMMSGDYDDLCEMIAKKNYHLLFVDLLGTNTVAGSSRDKRMATRTQRAVSLVLAQGRPVVMVGKKNATAWDLPSISALLSDPRMKRSLHNWCAYGILGVESAAPSGGRAMVLSNLSVMEKPCVCESRDSHATDLPKSERHHEGGSRAERVRQWASKFLRDIQILVKTSATTKAGTATLAELNSTLSFPTDAKMKQKADKAAGKVVQKRKMTSEQHYDDCGDSTAGLGPELRDMVTAFEEEISDDEWCEYHGTKANMFSIYWFMGSAAGPYVL
jgi:hypothetical protein